MSVLNWPWYIADYLKLAWRWRIVLAEYRRVRANRNDRWTAWEFAKQAGWWKP
jgi:hypothetical protein